MAKKHDFSQKPQFKKAILEQLKKVPFGAALSLPRNDDPAFDQAVREILAESQGRLEVMNFGTALSITRKGYFRGRISQEALIHLEEQGTIITSESVLEMPELPDMTIPRVAGAVDEETP